MASTSTAVNLPTNCCYEVFLNHRGSDTKKNIASHLYRGLVKQGVRVFWDKEEMQVGDDLTSQIQDAIKTASVHVAIFSPHYAESKWCLEELHLMVQSGKPIIPVFYKIEPGELKRAKGDYAKALRQHGKKRTCDSQPRYNSTTIGNWRTALYTVAEISGLELDKFNGDEGELVDEVVDSVRRKLRGTGLLDVAEHPTGLDEKIEDFEKKALLLQSDKAQVIGIVGMGAIGKTTLVKELFNRKKSQYSKSCFLADVRENARKASLESLQKKLLEGLTALKDEKIESVSQGIELLNHLLKKIKDHEKKKEDNHLVILDDVDHDNQLDALLRPIRDVLPSNSLILITSRDRDVLTRSRVEVSSIYPLTGLNPQHSKQLFCLHAFTQPHPLQGFEDLVDKYLEACNQLPLSLKVFGALLYGNHDKSFWEDHLERLEQILPDDIQRSLQISYDALQMDEKIIFLDISCFFIGERRDKAINIWEGCGLKGPRVPFRSLLSKNLVELEDVVDKEGVGADMEIRMHDHVRDLGRHLANNPSLPRRIWRAKDFEDLLQQSSVVTEVRGISMCWTKEEDPSFLPGFKIRNLKLLDIDYGYRIIDIEQENGHLESIMNALQSPNLIWLRTDARAYSCLPSSFPLTKLRVLEVHGERSLPSLWHEGSQARNSQLRELTIKAAFVLPSQLAHQSSLEILNLSGLTNLTELPSEIGRLNKLTEFTINRCTSLCQLSFKMVEGGEGICPSLKYLKIISCNALVEVGRLPDALIDLELADCPNLRKIEWLTPLSKLQELKLTDCEKLEQWPSLETLVSLEELVLFKCWTQRRIRRGRAPRVETWASLKELALLECSKLRSIRGLAHLTKLRILYVWGCCDLEGILGVEQLRANLQVPEGTAIKTSFVRVAMFSRLVQWVDSYNGSSDELDLMEQDFSYNGSSDELDLMEQDFMEQSANRDLSSERELN